MNLKFNLIFTTIFTFIVMNGMEGLKKCKSYQFLSQSGIHRPIWNTDVHYHIHKSSPPVPIVNQIIPIHVFISFPEELFKYYRPIYTCVFQVVSFHQVCTLTPCLHLACPHACNMSCPYDSSCFVLPNNVWRAVQIFKLLLM